MQFEQRYPIAAARPFLWDTLMDVHRVSTCIKGVEALNVIADDDYEGRMAVKMGPVNLRFEGAVKVTMRDTDNWIGVLEATAKDSKAGGGFKASLEMKLHEVDATNTDLEINLETTLLGRIGELGRPLIKKKINTMMDDFIASLNAQYVRRSDDA